MDVFGLREESEGPRDQLLAAGLVVSLFAEGDDLFYASVLLKTKAASHFEMVSSFLITDGGSAFYRPERLTHIGSP